tara:strand:+ start:301 stop:1053 length:753 start_codon:yes stop_codon:yes gene_type:complete
MEKIFEKKVVFVTGSTRGIGLSIAEKFSENGAKVFLNGRNKNFFKKAIEKVPRSEVIEGDFSNPKSVKKITSEFIKKAKKIDVLICNVGSGRSVPTGDEFYDEWLRMFNLNFWSAVSTIESLKENLIQSSATIICISSICGEQIIEGAPLTYSCAKGALNTYVKGIASSLGKKGVRINAIAPGNIIFPGSTWAEKIKNDKKAVDKILDEKVPLSRFGNPEEVAELACYLASSKGEFVTGSIWNIDGGQKN